MVLSAFAGRYAPHARAAGDRDQHQLELALHEEGPATGLSAPPLAVAWTPSVSADSSANAVCLLAGRARAGALTAELGLDPALPVTQAVKIGYARLRDDVLSRIEGEYALLIWDRDLRRGLLARDPLGSEPLFLIEAGGTLLFASEIRNLLALLPTRPGPDALAVGDWLSRTRAGDDRTLYEGIRRLPAGHAIRLGSHGWDRFRHWHPRYTPSRSLDGEQAAALLRAGLTDAVARALDGVERPGVMLSGGFDSAAVSAALDLRGDAGLCAYSAVFPAAPAVDESARIARVRDALGLEEVEAAFWDGSALSGALEYLEAWQVPSPSPNLFVWLPLLRRAAADGIDAMLDGEGGDELFGCAAHLLADRIRSGRFLGALGFARRLPGMGARPRPRWVLRAMATYGVRGALPYAPHQWLRRTRSRPSSPWLSEQAAQTHRLRDDPWRWKRGHGPRWWRQLSHQLTNGADGLGAAEHFRREGALTGVTLRHPLRDRQLIELVLSLPPELAFDPHLDRPLARSAFRGELPDEVLLNEDKPVFDSLLTSTLTGRDRAALHELLNDPHPELARQVRQGAVASLLDRPPRSEPAGGWGSALWRLASLELWLDHLSRPERVERMRGMLDPAPTIAFVRRAPVRLGPRPS